MNKDAEIRAAFAHRLALAAEQRGLPKHGRGKILAEALGITAKAASKYLNGEAMPRQANMLQLATFLRVPVESLQYGRDAKRQPTAPALCASAVDMRLQHIESTLLALLEETRQLRSQLK